jgi:hypothetical protein
MQTIDYRLAMIREREMELRSGRGARSAEIAGNGSLRLRLGQLLMQLGRRVGGEAMTTPAWQG